MYIFAPNYPTATQYAAKNHIRQFVYISDDCQINDDEQILAIVKTKSGAIKLSKPKADLLKRIEHGFRNQVRYVECE